MARATKRFQDSQWTLAYANSSFAEMVGYPDHPDSGRVAARRAIQNATAAVRTTTEFSRTNGKNKTRPRRKNHASKTTKTTRNDILATPGEYRRVSQTAMIVRAAVSRKPKPADSSKASSAGGKKGPPKWL